MFERTKRLLDSTPGSIEPREELIEILHSVIELLAFPENDFAWTSWESAAEAIREVEPLVSLLNAGTLPERLAVSVLFAPTGPMQEVSLSSGWAEVFVKVAERYDYVEKLLWPK